MKKQVITSRPNLAEKAGSMTYVLEHDDGWKNSFTIPELFAYIKDLFTTNGINTTASNRLLKDVSTSRNMTTALSRVYSSILAGENLSVI